MGRAGVGVTFAPNGEGVHIITALRPGGAAESCGRIVVNDILWGINNQVVKGMPVQQVTPPPPPPPSRTNRTRRVLHPVLIGHAASFTPY